MTKYFLSLAMILLVSNGCLTSAVREGLMKNRRRRDYGPAGCGLGSVWFGSSGQPYAATVNTAGSNTFAISSGTSNCHPLGSRGAATARQQRFFVANFATLAREAAHGDGEALTGLAGELSCAAGQDRRVAAQMKAHYRSIFSQPGAVAAFSAAIEQLRDEPELVAHCYDL